ncbi:M23 family metallopeptidase [Arcobacteraceae bacterium]|nr:M23 family metallopeptidase [Arcobacteraceae bacterium]
MKKILLILLLSNILFAKVDINLSHTNIKHGTTVAVILQSDTKLTQAPNVLFKNKTFQMFTINGSIKNYEVFIPVDYHSKKQKENIQIRYKEEGNLIKKNIAINIVDGHYRQNEIIKVAKGKVVLSKKNKNRSKEEYAKVYKNVYSQITPYDLTNNSLFEYPMKSKITSDFGNARVYNGTTKSYHTGTDFRAKVGTNIYAANDGKIALVMKRFYLGNVVYIDHGRGAYTYYSHMDSIGVQQGQKISKGDIIGKSGKTGRITGPHLHYAVRLYNTTVDPLQYTSLYNKILKEYH